MTLTLLQLPVTVSPGTIYIPGAGADHTAGGILMALVALFICGIGVFCALCPRLIAELDLRRRTDDDASPSDRAIRRVRTGGVLVALGGLGYFVIALIIIFTQ